MAASKKKKCANCNKDQTSTNFYATENLDIYPDGRIHLCKKCCNSIFENSNFEGFQKIMKLIDKPIYEEPYKKATGFGDYIRKINSMKQYKGLHYEVSNLFEEVINTPKKTKPSELTAEELKEAEDFFGLGYTEQDYIFLKIEYDDWINRYNGEGKSWEELIKSICLTQLDIRNKRIANKDVKSDLKTLQDLMTSANIKPVQETGAQSVDQETFGTLIKKIENERPISEPDPAWADVDGIGKYIRTFFLAPMARLFGKENPYKDEFDEEMAKYTVHPNKEDD